MKKILSALIALMMAVSMFAPGAIFAADNPNLALGKPAASSANEVDYLTPDLAFDGDTTSRASRWSSASTNNSPQWIRVDLGENKPIKQVNIFWEAAASRAFTIQVSENDTTWTTVHTVSLDATEPIPAKSSYLLPDGVEGRYVRMHATRGTTQYSHVSMYEMQIYSYEKEDAYDIFATVAPELSADGKTVGLTENTNPDYTITLFGSDTKEIVDLDRNVIQPLVDKTVNLIAKVENINDPEDVAEGNFAITIPGRVAANTGNTEPVVIPSLREWLGGEGSLTVADTARIVIADEALRDAAAYTQADFKDLFGFEPAIVAGAPANGDIYLSLDDAFASLGEEGYYMNIGDFVSIEAPAVTGAFYGTRTVLQILKTSGNMMMPKGEARDYPKYEQRGLQLDVARKFVPLNFLQDYLKLMSWYKMNFINIHLNDNGFTEYFNGNWDNTYSAFRLESDNFPGLTSTDGSYTKEEFIQLQLDGRAVGIDVIPEIDTPAHSLHLTKYGDANGLDLWSARYGKDHFDITKPDVYPFIKGIFEEYITGENPVFLDKVNIGTDEFDNTNAAVNEIFRTYTNDLLTLAKENGKRPYLWGALSDNRGNTVVNPEGATMLVWNNGYANPTEMAKLGWDMISINDVQTYIVPAAGYYADYQNNQARYDSWEANVIGDTTFPLGHPQIKGGAFGVWNDIVGNGISVDDIHDRVLPTLTVFSEKLWQGKRADVNFTQFQGKANSVGEAPRANISARLDNVPDNVVMDIPFEGAIENASDYDVTLTGNNVSVVDDALRGKVAKFTGGASYIETSVPDVGFGQTLELTGTNSGTNEGWTLAMSIKPDANNPDDAVLLESDKGVVKLKQTNTGKLGFSKEVFENYVLKDNYNHRFDYEVPENVWTNIIMTGNNKGTSLYVNGELVERLEGMGVPNLTGAAVNNRRYVQTLVLPTARIGSATNSFSGLMDNLKVYNRVLTAEEIGGMASVQIHDAEMPDFINTDPAKTSHTCQIPATVALNGSTFEWRVVDAATGAATDKASVSAGGLLTGLKAGWVTVEAFRPADQTVLDSYTIFVLDENEAYYVLDKKAGRALANNGDNVISAAPANGEVTQQWTITETEDGKLTLSNSGKYISASSSAALVMADDGAAEAAKFTVLGKIAFTASNYGGSTAAPFYESGVIKFESAAHTGNVIRTPDNTSFGGAATMNAQTSETSYTVSGDYQEFNIVPADELSIIDPAVEKLISIKPSTFAGGAEVDSIGTVIHDGGGAFGGGSSVAANVFRDDTTIYDGAANQGWVGLQLPEDQAKTVTAARILVRPAYNIRAYKAQIQASNNGTDWTTLHTFNVAPNEGAWTDVRFDNDTAYTYYRYVSPVNGYTNLQRFELYYSNIVNITPQANITSTYNNAGEHAKWHDGKLGMGNTIVGLIKNGAQTDPNNPAFAQFAYAGDADIERIEVVFEEMGAADDAAFKFTYNLLGRKDGQADWDMIAENETATRITGDNERTYEVNEKYSVIKLDVLKVDNAGNNQWRYPAMTEFRIFGTLPTDTENPDPTNIAFGKEVHAHSGHNSSSNVVDGRTGTAWAGNEYPAYIDVDLGENYNLDQVEVFTPVGENTQYTVYTSMDGRDYELLAEKDASGNGSAAGDQYAAGGKEARIVRVYVEYYSATAQAVVNEIKIRGEASGTEVRYAPAIDVEDYEDSEYDVEITEQDTIDEVKGIVERNFGEEYVDWFEFEIAAPGTNGYDFFEIANAGGKIQITGNSGVSLATGLNHYLKYYCNVHISQVGDQTDMPDDIVPVDGTVRKETAFPVRYSYNYCTFSYTMAFWGEEEWRKELDWLALNGVNLVLDLTAQEEVWRRFMTEIGYEHQDIKDFIVGPAYYGWAYMSNMYGFGGPIHDSWFGDRTALARKNQLIMRKFGMSPVLQGYCGMVPVDIADYDTSVDPDDVIEQGLWCGTQRPSMLRTDSDTFEKYTEIFYRVQEDVYGDITDYYATDPFHEGGDRQDLDETYIATKVMERMLEADNDAVWVIQSWQGNPTTALLNGLKDYRDNTLILDLHAEKSSRSEWDDTSHGGSIEFGGSPWVFCMLNNFGGRSGLRGATDYWVEELATLQQRTNHLKGIGIVPEGSYNNPFLYDLFFEVIWSETPDDMAPMDMDEWIKDYTTRRYGAESASAAEAWEIINAVAYQEDARTMDQPSESVFNARPSLNVTKASPYGSTAINIDTVAFRKALDLLLKDYNTLKESDAYLYDVADVLEQSLTHKAMALYNVMRTAYNNGDLAAFDEASQKFLEMADLVEDVLGTRKEFLIGSWLGGAKKISENMDDFNQKIFDLNGRALLTTWGAKNINRELYDYTNRQWAGMTQDYYVGRWRIWIDEARNNLQNGGSSFTEGNAWFDKLEWQWVIGHAGEGDNEDGTYTDEPNGLDLLTLAYADAETSVTIAQENGAVIADYMVYNDSDEPMNALCIVAAYDAEGKLTDVAQEELSLDARAVNTASIALPFDAAAAKAFLWDADTYVPLFDSVSLVNNIAVNGTATASSNENGRDPFYAIDGNTGTRWASPNIDGADAWLVVDLGAEYDINEVILTWENAYATQYNIEVATEAAPDTFTPVVEKTDGLGGIETLSFDPVRARYVKFQGVKRYDEGWGYSIWEFEIRGSKAEPLSVEE